MVETFPEDWSTALVLVAHPDDPEYGLAAAVARWTSEGKRVVYALATSGEAGIEGMAPDEAGPLREGEQIASAAAVGVSEVEFWGFEDSEIVNTAELRAKVAETVARVCPDVTLSLYGGAEWAPGMPNQRDHMEFAQAVVDAYDAAGPLFCNGPDVTHAVDVDGFTDAAIDALECHRVYLEVLDPSTPVRQQATAQVEMTTGPIDGFPAARATGFHLLRAAR
ncbi:GlcNAc-PI de-N-acetylase [Gordonia spumicola]|uniref:GlcNAc-PI de-N-acetylase n=1 Tax=Gordonia spumicola TaxID=589161 RepID=A0A7I9V8X3_9ACTN|nr:PIG-L deacetylase family protein [Gordonia spumicola]GEE01846.1 GlcNAc-PI de-N-acetylase [Gordonia spumicola]